MWNCVTCSPLVRLCVTIRLVPSFLLSRGQRLIVQRSPRLVFQSLWSVVLSPNGAERISFSLSLSRSPLTVPLSRGENCRAKERRGRKRDRRAKWRRRTGRIGRRVNHTLLHRRQKTLSTRCLGPLSFRNFAKPRRSGGGMRHPELFSPRWGRKSMTSTIERFLQIRPLLVNSFEE